MNEVECTRCGFHYLPLDMGNEVSYECLKCGTIQYPIIKNHDEIFIT